MIVDAILENSKNVVDIINKQLHQESRESIISWRIKDWFYVPDFGIVQFNLQNITIW
jgi:hypothetical protein